RKICEALDISILKKGPVHINVPFEEPLYDTVSKLSAEPEISNLKNLKNLKNLNKALDFWNSSKKKLIVVGTSYPDEISSEFIEKLANDPSVVVMTETTSNL